MSHVKFCCTCEVYEEPATVPVPFTTHVWLSGKYRKIYKSPIGGQLMMETRASEVDALKKTKAVLSGADALVLQAANVSSHI